MGEARTLYVFGDESGTMPDDDDGDVFVAATVAMMGPAPEKLPFGGERNQEWLIRTLHELKATPLVRFVLPYPGFGRLRRAVVNKLAKMATITAQTTGTNAKYFNPDPKKPFPARNDVWSRAMIEASQAGLFAAVLDGPVERVRFHIDRKSLGDTTKAAFLNLVGKNVLRLDEILKATASQFPRAAPRVIENLSGCNPEPQFTWADDPQPDPPDLENGHRLADILAYECCIPLRASRTADALDWLEHAGFKGATRNATPELVRDMHPTNVARWMAATGQPEPPLEFDDTPSPDQK